MTQNLPAANERRGGQRFPIRVPLTVLTDNREVPAFTRDLSNRGVYFCLPLADSALINHDFEFVIEFPPEITLSTCCRIRCKGRVVRTENIPRHETGVAAEILHYSFLREAPGV